MAMPLPPTIFISVTKKSTLWSHSKPASSARRPLDAALGPLSQSHGSKLQKQLIEQDAVVKSDSKTPLVVSVMGSPTPSVTLLDTALDLAHLSSDNDDYGSDTHDSDFVPGAESLFLYDDRVLRREALDKAVFQREELYAEFGLVCAADALQSVYISGLHDSFLCAVLVDGATTEHRRVKMAL
jgi:hypothetical protein